MTGALKSAAGYATHLPFQLQVEQAREQGLRGPPTARLEQIEAGGLPAEDCQQGIVRRLGGGGWRVVPGRRGDEGRWQLRQHPMHQ